jgi:hypothetical protein
METVLLELLHRLEAIEAEHEEIGDTEVRERMGAAVFNGFLKPTPNYQLAESFGMFTKKANKLVRLALAWFLPAARQAAQQDGLDTFHKRLEAFQNLNVRTEETNDYNDYFGWWNPSCYDEDGNFKGA